MTLLRLGLYSPNSVIAAITKPYSMEDGKDIGNAAHMQASCNYGELAGSRGKVVGDNTL